MGAMTPSWMLVLPVLVLPSGARAAELAVVGGAGYEDVEVSSRDAVRDALGNPVVGPDGRFVTDESAPRRIAYQTDGLIWDAGVLWRPSRRTSLEAYVGRRYGSMTYHGSFAYTPDSRTSTSRAAGSTWIPSRPKMSTRCAVNREPGTSLKS